MATSTQTTIPTLGLLEIIKSRSDRFGMLTRAPAKHPALMQFSIPGRKIYVVHQPEMVQHILQRNTPNYPKDEGYKVLALLFRNGLITNMDNENWRKQRKLLQPPFHRDSLANMCTIVADATDKLLSDWKNRQGSTINFTSSMALLTLEIVCKTLFTADISQEQVKMVWRNLNFLNEMAAAMAGNPWHIPWHLPLPRYVKARKYIGQLDELLFGIIHKRRQQQNAPHDLLQILIEARYDDGNPMTDEQIRDEVMTVFVAGHETTVNALSWTWYLLKKHSAAEQKLKEESAPYAVTTPAFGHIQQMKYGWCIMNEAMRIYPPVPAIGRFVHTDEEVCGIPLKAGRSTIINIAGLHHHPKYWENPGQFKPERFSNFDLRGENRFLFMPFGAGPHICIGNNFAMLEMQIINAMLSARVQMELVSTQITPKPLITLKPGEGVIMKLVSVI